MERRPLILASQSPQRRRILKSLRVPFRVIAPRVSENIGGLGPKRLVRTLALRKAAWVARRKREALVLGADTIVACRGKILFKPKSPRDSRRMLSLLNGSWHRVYTGVAVVDARSGRSWNEVTVSRVKARKLDPQALMRLSGKHLDKAGSYALQDSLDPFIEKVVGPVDNVIGLPLASVRKLIRKASRKNP